MLKAALPETPVMIVLHVFGPAFGLPDPSPFVMKTELLLKLSGLPYRPQLTGLTGLRRAPKGKLPYIEDAGVTIADSTFIRWHLENSYGIDFDQGLSPAQRGVAWALERSLEDHLYWAVVFERWLLDENFAKGPANFFRAIPAPFRPLVQNLARRKTAARLKAHGLGCHSAAEITALASRDLESVAAVLGANAYLMGKVPCGADATVLAFTAGILCPLFDTSLRKLLLKHSNLVAYTERLMQQYFPDHAGTLAAPDPDT
jgi:glutathione S-transferase